GPGALARPASIWPALSGSTAGLVGERQSLPEATFSALAASLSSPLLVPADAATWPIVAAPAGSLPGDRPPDLFAWLRAPLASDPAAGPAGRLPAALASPGHRVATASLAELTDHPRTRTETVVVVMVCVVMMMPVMVGQHPDEILKGVVQRPHRQPPV